MEQRLSCITLGVENLTKTKTFFETLGWKPSKVDESIIFFQMNGFVLGLFGREDLEKDAKTNLPKGGSITLAYNVREKEDVSKTLKVAEQAGAKILKPAEDVFWGGRSGYFSDPDGHVWEVAWNPMFPISDDGRTSYGE